MMNFLWWFSLVAAWIMFVISAIYVYWLLLEFIIDRKTIIAYLTIPHKKYIQMLENGEDVPEPRYLGHITWLMYKIQRFFGYHRHFRNITLEEWLASTAKKFDRQEENDV